MSVLRVGSSRGIAFVASVVAALLVVSFPGSTMAASPSLRILRVAGPMSISGNNHYASVATMPLPSGHWLVLVKLQLDFEKPGYGNVSTGCQLSTTGAGANTDTSFVKTPNSAVTGSGDSGIGEDMFLSVADTLGSPGSAQLRCGTSSGDEVAFLRLLRMVALPVAKLSVANMNGGSSSTVGSGSPQAAWGWSVTNTVIAANDTADIAAYPIPKGNWWITANAVAASSSGAVNGDCTAHDAHAAGRTLFGLAATPWAGEVQPFSTQYWTSAATNATAHITCSARGSDAAVQQATVAMLRLGKVVSHDIGAGTHSYGSGTPLMISGTHTGETRIQPGTTVSAVWGSMTLPAGKWLLSAHLDARISAGAPAAGVHCELRLGKKAIDLINTRMTTGTNKSTPRQSITFLGAATTTAAQHAKLVCDHSGSATVKASDFVMSAVQVSDIGVI